MFNNILHNFISPITGRVLADPNYVLVGNSKGIATPSPLLIDIRLDILNITRGTNIVNNASFVIGQPNSLLPNAQVLSSLSNGFLFNTSGIVSSYDAIPINNLTELTEGKIWVGDIFGRPQEATPVPGAEGPPGERGPPGISFRSIMREIFDGIFGEDLSNYAADIIDEMFQTWLDTVISGAAGLQGLTGLAGLAGKLGASNDKAGDIGISGSNAAKTKSTKVINTNLDMNGNRIENLPQSPETDFSLVTAKWIEDLLSSRINIEWQ